MAAAAGLAMENERLHAEVLARLEEVQPREPASSKPPTTHDDASSAICTTEPSSASSTEPGRGNGPGPARQQRGPRHRRPAARASDHAVLALRELRDLAHGLHRTILAEAGLVAGIESLAERSIIPVEVATDVHVPLPATVEVAAYYVVSEALANVAKHADASSVQVHVATRGDRLLVEVSDDGNGGAQIRPGSATNR